MKRAYVGIDPGQTTGLCAIVIGNERSHAVECASFAQIPATPLRADRDKYQQYERVAHLLLEYIHAFRKTAIAYHQIHPNYHEIVCEDFSLRTMAAELSPVYISCMLVGLRLGVARESPPMPAPKPIKWSSPSIRSAVPDEGLKQAQLWTAGLEHCRSATRHVVITARKQGFSGILHPRPAPAPPYFPE